MQLLRAFSSSDWTTLTIVFWMAAGKRARASELIVKACGVDIERLRWLEYKACLY